MKLHMTEIKYMGHLTTEDINPDPTKVQETRDTSEPKGSTHVKRILGTANHLSKFVP